MKKENVIMKKMLVKNCAECGCQFLSSHSSQKYCADCVRQRNKRYRQNYYQNRKKQDQGSELKEYEIKIKVQVPVKFLKLIQGYEE